MRVKVKGRELGQYGPSLASDKEKWNQSSSKCLDTSVMECQLNVAGSVCDYGWLSFVVKVKVHEMAVMGLPTEVRSLYSRMVESSPAKTSVCYDCECQRSGTGCHSSLINIGINRI